MVPSHSRPKTLHSALLPANHNRTVQVMQFPVRNQFHLDKVTYCSACSETKPGQVETSGGDSSRERLYGPPPPGRAAAPRTRRCPEDICTGRTEDAPNPNSNPNPQQVKGSLVLVLSVVVMYWRSEVRETRQAVGIRTGLDLGENNHPANNPT